MKPSRFALRISLALNFILAALCLGLWMRSGGRSRSEETAAPQQTKETTPASGSHSASLRWSAIESVDIKTYLGNLRSIGCPEPVIRKIITGEIDSLYARKRLEAQNQLAEKGADAVAQLLEDLQKAESDELGSLLGPDPSETVTASNSPDSSIALNSTAGSNHSPAEQELAPLPLALVEQHQDLHLTEDQVVAWEHLRQRFLATLGKANQDPSDPKYLETWEKARSDFDQQFKALFGTAALQMQQWQSAHDPEVAPPASK